MSKENQHKRSVLIARTISLACNLIWFISRQSVITFRKKRFMNDLLPPKMAKTAITVRNSPYIFYNIKLCAASTSLLIHTEDHFT